MMDKNGLKFCRFAQWLSGLDLFIGLFMAIGVRGEALWPGLAMAALGAWGWFTFHQVPAHPAGLSGSQRWIVTPYMENAIRRDALAPGPKDRYSTLHAAKRFGVCCFFGGLTWGFFGNDGLLTAFVVALGSAMVYEWLVCQREEKAARRRQAR